MILIIFHRGCDFVLNLRFSEDKDSSFLSIVQALVRLFEKRAVIMVVQWAVLIVFCALYLAVPIKKAIFAQVNSKDYGTIQHREAL